MIVDVETHIWDTPQRLGPDLAASLRRGATLPADRPDGSTTAHDAAMEPVQRAIVLGLTARRLNAEIPANLIAGYVADRPDKYVGFAGIDPTDAGWSGQLDAALALGLAGVAISPALAGFVPGDPTSLRLFERCAEHGLPVIVDTAVTRCPQAMLELTRATRLDGVLRRFPDLPVVIGQLGDPWAEVTLTLLAKHPQVYASVAGVADRPWQLYHVLRLAHERGVMGQLLLGSGFPWSTPARVISGLLRVNDAVGQSGLDPIPRNELDAIVHRDALACLGLPQAKVAASPRLNAPTLA